MSALLLPAVDGTGRKAGIALAADFLLAVECPGNGGQRGVKHSTTQTQHEVQRRLLLNVVVAERAAVLELLASKDEALLVRGDALLVLDLGLDVVDGVARLHLKGDRLAREGLNEDLKGGEKKGWWWR